MARPGNLKAIYGSRFNYQLAATAHPNQIEKQFIMDLDRLNQDIADIRGVFNIYLSRPNEYNKIWQELTHTRDFINWLIQEYRIVGTPQLSDYATDLETLLSPINQLIQIIQSNPQNSGPEINSALAQLQQNFNAIRG
jgi:hypothetical protein